MFFKLVLFVCAAYFVSDVSAADKCWYNNCQNTTTCPENKIECTQQVALDSVQYLNSRFNNTIDNSTLSSKYDCFRYTTNSSKFLLKTYLLIFYFIKFYFTVVWYDDGSNVTSYTSYRSCLPKNVDVCKLGKEDKSAAYYKIIVGASSGSGCGQCNGNYCNSSVNFIGSWKTVSAVLLFLVLTGFSYKF